MTGESIPYSLIGDNLVMSLFLLNLLAMAYVFLMNGSSILERTKSMFYYGKQSNPYNDRTHITRICNFLLYWQTVFYGSITLFGYMQYGNPAGMDHTAAYTHLLQYALLLVIALILKSGVTHLCNTTLFGENVAKEWDQSYFFTIKLLGFILFPIVVCCMFVKGFPKSYYTIYIIFVTLLYLAVIISRSIKIIFAKKCNYLDIFLYLCALELLPMAFLWKTIHIPNAFLIIKF